MWIQARSPGPAAGIFVQAFVCIPASAVQKVFEQPSACFPASVVHFCLTRSRQGRRNGDLICVALSAKLHKPVFGARPGPASSLPLDGQQQTLSWPRALSCECLGEYLPVFHELGRGLRHGQLPRSNLFSTLARPGRTGQPLRCLTSAVMLPQIHADIEDWQYAVCALCEVCVVF